MTAPWGPHAGVPAMLIGVALVVWALRRYAADLHRPVTDPRKALGLALFLRVAILGSTIVAVGAALVWSLPPLALVAVVIAGEETIETSVVVAALRAAPTRAHDAPTSGCRASQARTA